MKRHSKAHRPDISGSAVVRSRRASAGVIPDSAQARRPVPRGLLFALLSAACLLVATGYVAWAVLRAEPAPEPTATTPVSAGATRPARLAGERPDVKGVSAIRDQPRVVFQNASRSADTGKVALATLEAPDGTRVVTELACERVHVAADTGLCLMPDRGLITRYFAYTFGPDFRVTHKLALSGIPSRARVSPDGRYGATTVFVSGHSYAEAGFSTATTIIDMKSGTSLGNLERFAVFKDGKRFRSPDFNFWGVTYARESNHFYATLGTRGKIYLVEGDVAKRSMRVLRENVECPSLSPDGTRLAFKKRVAEGPRWRLYVLELATMEETPLAETRSIDDQVEWLDEGHILYGVPEGLSAAVWAVPADGTGTPRKFIPDALSPAVLR